MIGNYKGSAITALYKAAEKNPEMSLGEILYSCVGKRALSKNFVTATDEEIYNSVERFVKTEKEDDERMSDDEFVDWLRDK